MSVAFTKGYFYLFTLPAAAGSKMMGARKKTQKQILQYETNDVECPA